ncbi:SCO family protein [Zestomonas carbonaria]|uniref:SCO family protein n=1 Tax=Zestomonas carbonaria TaxID=2762745 RepID=A0A7U7EPU2_9GAMM|nr:SCO family protein [Pseudomonas carbonaria]CAD5108977.1 hypothetical protein PSEWESI4_03273 [Pseudomonas carbonaria]
MKPMQGIALAIGMGLAVAVAQAHEGHAGSEPAAAAHGPAIQPVTAAGTHDAQAYFTDTRLLTQDGQEVAFYSDVLKDRLVLLNVIFTHCNDACPLITRKLKEVRDALGEPLAREVYFISLTSDPHNDSPQVLKEFAAKHGVDSPNWLFLTGPKERVDLVLSRLGHLVESPEQHSTVLIAGDVANKRWSKIRPDAPVSAITQRLQLMSMPPVANR